MSSRLARKYQTNKKAETEGIFYEEVDDDGPLFRVRLARVGGDNNKYKEKVNKLMKPFRNTEISFKRREKLVLEAYCATCIIPNTWETYVDGEWKPGIEDPQTGNLLPATPANYELVLGQLTDLYDRLLTESSIAENYKSAALETESKN